MPKLFPILLFIFSLFTLSIQQRLRVIVPPVIPIDFPDKIETILLGIGDISMAYTEANTEDQTEWGSLPWITTVEEWTFDLITNEGEIYSYVSHGGEVVLVGPNEYDVNISQEYADLADIDVNDVADRFTDIVAYGFAIAAVMDPDNPLFEN